MSDLLAARSQMAMSLAFHILLAVAGMAMPLLMVLAQWRHQRTGDPAALDLAKRWAKGTAMFNDAVFSQTLHMSLAAYASIAVAVMGVHAWALRSDRAAGDRSSCGDVALFAGPLGPITSG